ncbi:MAG TPA: SCO family protein [Verrucomicrobiae bacterium]|jgi:protein SCO1/2
MKTLLITCVLFLAEFFVNAATNGSLSDEQLLQIKFDQKLGAQISPALLFHDETGKQVRLSDYFGEKPTVLILGYYGCPMLCTLTLNGATECFQDLKWTVGDQFDVIFVSIDPTETPQLASEKKQDYLRIYRRGHADGWHFLTGGQISIRALTDEVGFHYAYDSKVKQFAHPSGLVVLTSGGKVSHYFFGVTFAPDQLDAALHDASARKIGSPIDELFLLCFHYSPLTGKYGHLVILIVRAAGVATMLAVGLVIFIPARHKPKRPS